MRLVKDGILKVWEQRRAEARDWTTDQARGVKTIQQKLASWTKRSSWRKRSTADDSVTLAAEGSPAHENTLESSMTRILLLGLEPETVDFSDPALPPGMNAEKIRAGIEVAVKQFADRGWEFDVGFIRPDETAGPTVERQLRSTNYDCVVVGGGVRLPPRHLALFEVVINAIRQTAPGAAIAFNTRPDDSADAAARGLALGRRTA